MDEDIEMELRDVEVELAPSLFQRRMNEGGRAVSNSIRSALSNIRHRLEHRSESVPTPPPPIHLPRRATSNTASLPRSPSLLERLRNAEMAHMNCAPLDTLCSSNRDNRCKRNLSPGDEISSSSESSSPRFQRQSSTLKASRRRIGPETAESVITDCCRRSLSFNGQDSKKLPSINDHQQSEKESDVSVLLSRKSRSSLNIAHQLVLFPDHLDQSTATIPQSSTQVYSWGNGITTFHETTDNSDIVVGIDQSKVDATSRVGRSEILSVSAGPDHIACCTVDGRVFVAGRNTVGQADPDRRDVLVLRKPVVLESLLQARIVEVSCGADHTAALRSNGTVLTWGSNQYGQLGHSIKKSSASSFVRPSAMALRTGQRATSVASGDGFTLCLTTRMQLLVAGVTEITGRDDHGEPLVEIPALRHLPLVGIFAGYRHAVVTTSHGTAFVWGDNASGCCGQEYPKSLTIPVPIKFDRGKDAADRSLPPPLSNWKYMYPGDADKKQFVKQCDDTAIVSAACGKGFTILVSRAGSIYACGSNDKSQLGQSASDHPMIYSPTKFVHLSTDRRFVSAAAGNHHCLLLDDVGDVWRLGERSTDTVAVNVNHCECVLKGSNIKTIAACADHNIAVEIRVGRQSPQREFSESASYTDCATGQEAVEDLLLSLEKSSDETALVTVKQICKRTEELLRTPAVLNSLSVDPVELHKLYNKLLNVKNDDFRQQIVAAHEYGMSQGITSLKSSETRLMRPEQVLCLLHYLQCPLFNEDDASKFDRRCDLILNLLESLLEIPYEGYRAVIGWALSLYTRSHFQQFILKPLHQQMRKSLSFEAGAQRRSIPELGNFLRVLYRETDSGDNGLVRPEDFYCSAVNEMDSDDLFRDLQSFNDADEYELRNEFFFCAHAFLLSPTTKRTLLQMENEMNMIKTATSEMTYNAELGGYSLNPFYVLEVERKHLLTHTLKAVSEAKESDLRKKLRVVFKGEQAVDAGGVTREFFHALNNSLFDDVGSGLWSISQREISITWFNSDCFWNDEGFYLSGVLLGLAVYNSVLIDTHFPPVIYRKLLGLPLGLEDLLDSTMKRSLQSLLDYEESDVEGVFCLTFEVNWTVLGETKTRELKPNGADIPVTFDNKEEYVLLYVRWILVDSVYAQYESFQNGFMKIMKDTSLHLLQPAELELLIVGSTDLDFHALKEKALYEGFDADSPVIKIFWAFVMSASRQIQLNLLKFTTGSTRAPIGGLGCLPFKIQKAGADSLQLPSSHTCFNTLLLPDYGDQSDKLERLLFRALDECEGFGLE